MGYGENGAAPRQLTSILGSFNGTTNPSFTYDANGNMTGGAGRSFSWTSFNKASSLTVNSTSLALAYGSEHQRYKMCTPNCTAPAATTRYIYDPATGAASEKYTDSNGSSTWRDWIVGPDGQIVAERFKGSNVSTYYTMGDHLGSIVGVANSTPSAEERDSYDAWGKRRNADATDDPTCAITSLTTRGFTGHEMLDSVCLINMNARVYDATLGMFLSADSIVPDPYNVLSYYRYAYLNNNPLNAADPTGHADTPDAQKARQWCIEGNCFSTAPSEAQRPLS